jgi:hypothetical protein
VRCEICRADDGSHDTVTRLKNDYLPPSLALPGHVSLQTKVFSTGRGQAIFDEVEETMQGKLERLVKSDDTYNMQVKGRTTNS